MKNRIISFLLVLCLCISCMSTTVLAYTNHTQAEAVAWIQARKAEGWAKNYDGSKLTIPQCVDLIVYYFDYLAGYHLNGNAYDYLSKTLPSGWTYTSTPSPGDIAVWGKNVGIATGYGHVALVESVSNGRFSYIDVKGSTGKAGSGSVASSNPSKFIHPDFPTPPSAKVVDLGADFYANIFYIKAGAFVETAGGDGTTYSNVQISAPSTSSASLLQKQVWHFIRQNNGSYKIVNESTGWCLDVYSAYTDNDTNIQTWYDDNNTMAQRWFITNAAGNGQGYNIVSALEYPAHAMDVYAADTAAGTNIQLYARQNDNTAQQFAITPLPNYTPTVSVAGVSLDKNSVTLKVGESTSINATVTPTNATNKSFTWSSSNSSIASVTSNGIILAHKSGTATITARTNDGGKTSSCTVTVITNNSIPGDVNNDGVLANADLVLLARYIVQLENMLPNMANADIDKDGIITNSDLVSVAKLIVL